VYALAATLLAFAVDEPLCEATGEAAMLAEIATRGLRRELCHRATGLREVEREMLYEALSPNADERPKTARQVVDAFRFGPR